MLRQRLIGRDKLARVKVEGITGFDDTFLKTEICMIAISLRVDSLLLFHLGASVFGKTISESLKP